MAALYSSLKFLRFGEHLKAIADGRVLAPVHIRVKPTNRCNHDCWYCAYRNDSLSLGGEMSEKDSIPEAKMLVLAHEFVDMGVKAVTFSGGGEPLLYKPLPKVIEILAAGGIRVAALSNGTNLQGRVAETLAQHGTWIRISLDAWDDASYTKSRGAQALAFTRLLKNIRAFTATGTRCVLGVSFIVGKENHRRIEETCALLKECGINHVKVSATVVGNDPTANNAYHRSIKDEVARQIAAAQLLAGPGFSVLNHYHDLEERFKKLYHRCGFLRFLTVIGADQKVYTCQDKAYTEAGRMGSLVGKTFREFWFSEENRRLLNSFDPSVECPHHCVTHPKNLAIHEYLSLDQEHSYFV